MQHDDRDGPEDRVAETRTSAEVDSEQAASWWARATMAAPEVTDPEDRRSAQLLAAVLLAIAIIGSASALIQFWFVPAFTPIFLTIMAAVAAIGVLYLFSRTVHFRLAAILASLVPVVGGAAVGLLQPTDPAWFAFMALGPMVASAFLSLRLITVVGATYVAATLATLSLGPQAPSPHEWASIGFFSMAVAIVVVFVARHLRTLEELRSAMLAQSRRRFADLYNHSPDMYFTLEADGTISSVNETGAVQLGYTTDELMGQPVSVVVHPDDLESVTEQLARFRRDKSEPADLAFRKVKRDGAVIWVHERVRVIPGGDGDGRLQVVCRDVTHRRLAEHELHHRQEALERSERAYRNLFDNAPYGIYRSTRSGRFTTVNRTLVEMLGYDSEEEVLALDMAKDLYVGAEHRDWLLRQTTPGKRIENLTADWKTKDGRVLRVRLSGRQLPTTSSEEGAFEMLAEDVTEREALEAKLMQAQKMEVIGQFTGGVAHDINNLLTVVIARGALIAEDLSEEQAHLRHEAQSMVQAAERSADMIKKLLAFSRQQQLEAEPLDLGEVCEDLFAMLGRLVPETIELNLSREDTALAEVDRTAVEQILLNLATNSRDAMPSGGTITITIGTVTVTDVSEVPARFVHPGRYVRMSFSDTGVGMDTSAVNRIFEPFYSTKPIGEGTGLGLAMVYGLVKQHHGYITVDSAPGRGTTVSVYLPAVGSNVPRSITAEKPTSSGGGEKILVVDDEPLIRSSTARILERYGYEVLVAEDGRQALSILQETEPPVDLVLTDMVMPNLTGPELHRVARAEQIPARFLFMSGYAGPEVRDLAEADVPFLEKPWGIPDLLHAVREALD